MPWSSHSCNDHMQWNSTHISQEIFAIDVKILFGATSEACSGIVTTIWRPGLS